MLIWGCGVTEGCTWDQWHLSWSINASVAVYYMTHFGYLLPINSAWGSGSKYLSQHGHTQSNVLLHSNLISRSVSPENSSQGTNNVDTTMGQVWHPALCLLQRATRNSLKSDDSRCGRNEILLLYNNYIFTILTRKLNVQCTTHAWSTAEMVSKLTDRIINRMITTVVYN